MTMRFALAGNPNCGKTTMFNAMTGANQYVGNWPGVTVEKKEGKLKSVKTGEEVVITDLPGIYSLSPYTLEEVVSRDYLLKERPDVIINLGRQPRLSSEGSPRRYNQPRRRDEHRKKPLPHDAAHRDGHPRRHRAQYVRPARKARHQGGHGAPFDAPRLPDSRDLRA